MNIRLNGLLLAAALGLPGAAIAGHDDAELALARAETAVSAAERAGAVQLASRELEEARMNLAASRGSFEERDYDDAERQALEAHLDGRWAEARSRQTRAEAHAAELQAAINVLRGQFDPMSVDPTVGG